MFFSRKSEKEGYGDKKTYHNSQRAVACNMFNLKNLIKIVSRLSQLSVKPKSITTNLNNLLTF